MPAPLKAEPSHAARTRQRVRLPIMAFEVREGALPRSMAGSRPCARSNPAGARSTRGHRPGDEALDRIGVNLCGLACLTSCGFSPATAPCLSGEEDTAFSRVARGSQLGDLRGTRTRLSRAALRRTEIFTMGCIVWGEDCIRAISCATMCARCCRTAIFRHSPAGQGHLQHRHR